MSLNERFVLGDLIAVQWCPEMAEKFPNAEHFTCRQEMYQKEPGCGWYVYEPPRCMGYHCPLCGEATNSFGHHHHSGTRGCQ